MKKLFALIGALILAATPLQAIDGHKLEEKIGAQIAKFTAAYNKGDAAGVAALYTTDGALMADGTTRVVGRAAIEAAFTAATSGPKLELGLVVDSLEKQGNFVLDIGTWNLKIMPEGVPAIHQKGDYLVIWKMEDGEWRIYQDIYNTAD